MSEFHFLRPLFLILFLPLIVLSFWIIRNWRKTSVWNKICSEDLLPYVLARKSKGNNLPYLLMLFVGALLILALAGPTWEQKSVPLLKTQSGLVVVLDLSPSMNAEDIKPSRLQRALYKITDILNIRKEGQVALIVYSEDPYVVTPLTDDVATIKAMLPVLETNIMPSYGHGADKAINKARELLEQAGITNGSILLIASELTGVEVEKGKDISQKYRIPISVLGMGTEAGAPIPMQAGGFLKDEKGALVVSALSKDYLRNLAKSTGGNYVTISSDDSDIHLLVKGFLGIDLAQTHELTELTHNKWHDAGYWFVLLAIPFASLLFRRGILSVLLLFLMPAGLHALSWNDLWKTPDQQGQHLYHEEQYQEAKDKFQNLDWKGTASYRLEDYETAAECFKCNQTVEGFYNHGTTKAKQGDFEGALQAYAKALEIDPNHEDTLYNKKIIEDLMKEQEEDKDQNKDQEQEEDKDQNKDQEQEKSQDDKDQQDQTADNQEQKDQNDKQDESTDQAEEKNEPKEPEETEADAQEEQDHQDPQQQMDERWLQKVTDDPGGLLRRKFLQQYRQQTKR